MITPVYAAEPTPEVNCCMSFERGFGVPEECNQFELTKEKCESMVKEYESWVWWIDMTSLASPVIMFAFLIFIAWLLWKGVKKIRGK